jgi:hypothetical protein
MARQIVPLHSAVGPPNICRPSRARRTGRAPWSNLTTYSPRMDVTLTDEILDRVYEIVPPGTDIGSTRPTDFWGHQTRDCIRTRATKRVIVHTLDQHVRRPAYAPFLGWVRRESKVHIVAGVHNHRATSGLKPDITAGHGTCTRQPPRRCTTQSRRFGGEVPRNSVPRNSVRALVW